MATKTVTVILVETECAACGLIFGLPQSWDSALRDTGSTFYCPNGHTLQYNSRIEALRKKVAQLESTNTHLRDQSAAAERGREAAERSRAALQGVITKERKRVANGVCPCCKRSFQNLHRHMANQHPNFSKETA